jgi:hypothetical protein
MKKITWSASHGCGLGWFPLTLHLEWVVPWSQADDRPIGGTDERAVSSRWRPAHGSGSDIVKFEGRYSVAERRPCGKDIAEVC